MAMTEKEKAELKEYFRTLINSNPQLSMAERIVYHQMINDWDPKNANEQPPFL